MFLNRILINSRDKNAAVKKTATALLDRIYHLKGLKFKKINTFLSPQKKIEKEDKINFEKGKKYPYCSFNLYKLVAYSSPELH